MLHTLLKHGFLTNPIYTQKCSRFTEQVYTHVVDRFRFIFKFSFITRRREQKQKK